LGRLGLTALNLDPLLQLLQLSVLRLSFHLDPVAAPVSEAWIRQPLLQATLIGEQ
tara:strand:+ start:1448 stop:1612 length:165 start_codon:yes stop_codon:yes gene_type:complete